MERDDIESRSELLIKTFSDLDRIIERCGRKPPEEKIAEILAFIGLIEMHPEGYKLTELGKKFLDLSIKG